MKQNSKVQSPKSKVLVFLLLAAYCLQPAASAYAKIYIDITSPSIKKLPIAVSEFTGPSGREIPDVIKDDLDFTGIFVCLDRNAFLETSLQPFNRSNWSLIGVEAVLKGSIVKSGNNLIVKTSLYDVLEGKEIFRKEYQADASLLRVTAHAIANDVYKYITGENGVFRTKVAYIIRHKGHDSLYLMDWDGYRADNLGGIGGSIILSPHWSGDGSRLIYTSERNRQWGIYLLDFKKMTEKKVFSSAGINMAGDFFPGADEIAMSSSMNNTPSIYVYRISESRLTRITASRGIDVSPAVSPDGSSVAFVSDRDGSPQIFIMNKKGYDIRRLTFEGSYNTSPSWSPKGDKVVFSGRHDGWNQIFIINPDGSGIIQLTDKGNNEDPCFSPDGRYIAFTSDRDGERAIYIMRSNGEAQKRITPKGASAFGPRWSTY